MPDLDLVEALPDNDVVMFGVFMGQATIPNYLGALRDRLNKQPSAAKLEGPNCFSNPKYNKPIQLTSSSESRRRTKPRTEGYVEDAGTSGMSIPSVLPLMDSNNGQAHSSDDDNDFVAPPPRQQEPSTQENPPLLKTIEVLRVQVSEVQANNKVLREELEDIKSHMSSLNEGKINKMDDIIQMQAYIKSDLMDIRTNMQFLSESVSIMISSAMDEIIRRFGNRTSEHGVGQK
ncbi:Hypothetical predicted protein [Olea europaea subsp. europaea]|uniref:Uncharacterized protein n=1 Tax=Olea europaea subsp. europaea TaxID=158383 RepID=A0A8S0QZE0_OLEEU|nr:Hypothetical predicted protein [Olea europaea subsp. europaea]